jgi:hypothetical protein
LNADAWATALSIDFLRRHMEVVTIPEEIRRFNKIIEEARGFLLKQSNYQDYKTKSKELIDFSLQVREIKRKEASIEPIFLSLIHSNYFVRFIVFVL